MVNPPQQKSIYDISLKGVDGNDDILKSFKGMVTLIINTTGDCGNAPQFGIIEKIYQEYKDRGFRVLAVPTNDFCGPKVTYGIDENGIPDAKRSEQYGRTEWGVTYPFSELVSSKIEPHELYKNLNPDGEEAPKHGNFEKFLVDRYGRQCLRVPNFVLLDYAVKDGLCDSPEIELARLKKYIEIILEEPYDPNETVDPNRIFNWHDYLALV